jgi:hypothetical protein
MARNYKKNNKAHVNEYTRNWKQENNEHVKEYNHNYFVDNSVQIQARTAKNHARYRKENPQFRFAMSLRKRIRTMIKKKSDNSMNLIGCSAEFFVRWIEYQSVGSGFNLDNYGVLWQLDHVVPCCNYDLEKEVHQLLCFHWSNHQPLGCIENASKNNKIDLEMIRNQAKKATEFLNLFNSEQLDLVTKTPIFVNVFIQESQNTKH